MKNTQQQKPKMIECIIDPDGKPVPILDMWESFTGWYWFITEINPIDPDEMFGLVIGFEEEWGYIFKPELERQLKKTANIWPVAKENWSSNSHVKMIDANLIH